MYVEALNERIGYFLRRGNRRRAYAAYNTAWKEYRTIKDSSDKYADFNENIAAYQKECRKAIFKIDYFALLIQRFKEAIRNRL